MTYQFSAAQVWPQECALKTQGQLKTLASKLPKSLRPLAHKIHASGISWEYKYFWSQTAHLLVRQKSRVNKIKGAWGPIHDQLFEDWNRSEHAEIFLKTLNKTSKMKVASLEAEKKVALQLQAMASDVFNLKLKTKSKVPKIFELGQFPKDKSSSNISLARNEEIVFESWDKKNFKKHLENITHSLALIKTHSPTSYEYFKSFTKKIIPIQQKELVSYSLQSLPGHSFINLYNRDRLDLLDDLLHENGHHHLNHFLILEEPLVETPELTYYSPWREARRPLRGIFHAYMTFYFAQKLYFDLMNETQLKKFECTKAEAQKILYRFCEETLSLNYTAKDIERAYRAKKITKMGHQLFSHFRGLNRKMAESFVKAYKLLDPIKKKKIKKLAENLDSQERWTIS
jgi:hypothetical protein